MIRMRLEYVRSFVGVVNYKSFSQAAKYLFLSQPTISTHIRQLEEELGAVLLVRSTKNVQLSEKGKLFYPYALQLLETETQVMKQLKPEEYDTERTITIAVSSVPGCYMFPQFLPYCMAGHEDVNFRVLEGDSEDVLQKLMGYDVEIGIGSLDCGSNKLYSEVLFEDEIILLTPNKAKYRSMNGTFPVEQLYKENFIVRAGGSGTRLVSQNMEEELKLDLSRLHVVAQFESSELVRRAVEAGGGIAFISRTAARESLESHKALEFSFPNVEARRNIYLMYRADYILTHVMEDVINALRCFCREHFAQTGCDENAG